MIPPAEGHLQFRHERGFFLLRAAGIGRRGDDVLLHRAEGDDFWSLPGGRVLFGETGAETIAREMLEETGHPVDVGGLAAIVENHFHHEGLDRALDVEGEVAYHELGLYFHMDVAPELARVDEFWGFELAGTDREFRLEFRWVNADDLARFDVRPDALRPVLLAPVAEGVHHIVNHG